MITVTATLAGLYRDLLEPMFTNKQLSRMEGELGHLEQGIPFEKFLSENSGKLVEFDCYFSTTSGIEVSDGGPEDKDLEFTIRTETSAGPGEDVEHSNSTGVTVLVAEDNTTGAMFGFNAGTWFLKGTYEITNFNGTNMGYWFVRLTPVRKTLNGNGG